MHYFENWCKFNTDKTKGFFQDQNFENSFVCENDLYNLTLNQIPFEKNSEISLNKGDVISFLSNGTTKNSIIVDVLLTDLDEEYLVYNDIDLF